MRKYFMPAIVLLSVGLTARCRSQVVPKSVNVRFSEQISNAPPGGCGCFELEGGAVDAAWGAPDAGMVHGAIFTLAADAGIEHTGSVGSAPYGLTLTTVTAGPRFWLPGGKLRIFGQVLLGIAHGSNSEFPHHNSLVPSATSFALDMGAGAERYINPRVSVRFLQVDYLRTALPNTSTNWQSNLRVGAGITLHFSIRSAATPVRH
jgi:hypothetical protein